MGEIAHLTDEQRNQIMDKCQVAEQKFMEIRSEMEAKPRHEDLSVTLADIEKQ